VVQRHVVTHFCRLADHHTHPMIDKDAPPNLRAGMDLNPGQHPADMGGKTAEPAQPVSPEPARELVYVESMQGPGSK
jgi:hypothetical protein